MSAPWDNDDILWQSNADAEAEQWRIFAAAAYELHMTDALAPPPPES